MASHKPQKKDKASNDRTERIAGKPTLEQPPTQSRLSSWVGGEDTLCLWHSRGMAQAGWGRASKVCSYSLSLFQVAPKLILRAHPLLLPRPCASPMTHRAPPLSLTIGCCLAWWAEQPFHNLTPSFCHQLGLFNGISHLSSGLAAYPTSKDI